MTEFARKPSKLHQWWRRFWPALRSCLRDLWHGVLPGVTPDPCPLLADPDFWNDIVLQPAMPQPEPRAIPLPDPAPAEAAGLVVRLGPQGYGPVYYNGVELRFVKEVIIYVRAGEPVTATVIMDAREGFDLQAAVCMVDFVKQKREVVPNATPDEIPNAGA